MKYYENRNISFEIPNCYHFKNSAKENQIPQKLVILV